VKWFLSEDEEYPTPGVGWEDKMPDTYNFVSSTEDGLKTVWVWSQDEAGNISAPGKDSIIFDTQFPIASVNSFSQFQTSSTFEVSWWGSEPSPGGILTSGISNYDF